MLWLSKDLECGRESIHRRRDCCSYLQETAGCGRETVVISRLYGILDVNYNSLYNILITAFNTSEGAVKVFTALEVGPAYGSYHWV